MTSLPAGVRDPSDRFEFLRSLSLTLSLPLSLCTAADGPSAPLRGRGVSPV